MSQNMLDLILDIKDPYMGLVDPDDNEVSFPGYARQAIPWIHEYLKSLSEVHPKYITFSAADDMNDGVTVAGYGFSEGPDGPLLFWLPLDRDVFLSKGYSDLAIHLNWKQEEPEESRIAKAIDLLTSVDFLDVEQTFDMIEQELRCASLRLASGGFSPVQVDRRREYNLALGHLEQALFEAFSLRRELRKRIKEL